MATTEDELGTRTLDRMIALMYEDPQVHVDKAVIGFTHSAPSSGAIRSASSARATTSGLCFASDRMVWADAIPVANAPIRQAPFLTDEQKRDILHDNATRFLRLR